MAPTLEELDGEDWGEPQFDSNLVRNCHRLRKKPVEDFSIEDFRIMIGQGFCLEYLSPLALEQLAEDPLASGAFFPGDLLAAMTHESNDAYWRAHREQLTRLIQSVKSAVVRLGAEQLASPELQAVLEGVRSTKPEGEDLTDDEIAFHARMLNEANSGVEEQISKLKEFLARHDDA